MYADHAQRRHYSALDRLRRRGSAAVTIGPALGEASFDERLRRSWLGAAGTGRTGRSTGSAARIGSRRRRPYGQRGAHEQIRPHQRGRTVRARRLRPRYYGDVNVKPNPNLAPIGKPPFCDQAAVGRDRHQGRVADRRRCPRAECRQPTHRRPAAPATMRLRSWGRPTRRWVHAPSGDDLAYRAAAHMAAGRWRCRGPTC